MGVSIRVDPPSVRVEHVTFHEQWVDFYALLALSGDDPREAARGVLDGRLAEALGSSGEGVTGLSGALAGRATRVGNRKSTSVIPALIASSFAIVRFSSSSSSAVAAFVSPRPFKAPGRQSSQRPAYGLDRLPLPAASDGR